MLFWFGIEFCTRNIFAEIDTCELQYRIRILYCNVNYTQVSKYVVSLDSNKKTNFILLITEKFVEQDMRLQFDQNKKM